MAIILLHQNCGLIVWRYISNDSLSTKSSHNICCFSLKWSYVCTQIASEMTFCSKQKQNAIALQYWSNSQTWTNGHYLRHSFYLSFHLSLIIWSSSSVSSMLFLWKTSKIQNTFLCWCDTYFYHYRAASNE